MASGTKPLGKGTIRGDCYKSDPVAIDEIEVGEEGGRKRACTKGRGTEARKNIYVLYCFEN